MSNKRYSIPDPNAAKVPSTPLIQAANAVIKKLPKDYSFALLVFPPGKPLAYVSNGTRESVLKLLRDFVDSQEVPPTADE